MQNDGEGTPTATLAEIEIDAPINVVAADFATLGVSAPVVAALKRHGFTAPTGIQGQTIPLILARRDLIGQAETGSGKTLACSIPAVQMVDPADKRIQVLILCPTRELAVQYYSELALIADDLKLTPFAVYGGFDKGLQRSMLDSGVQLLVATPGRLMDLIYNNYLPVNGVKMFIIDEADEMLDMGFVEDIDFIASCLVQDHQTLLFSATMPAPIKALAQKYLKDPVHIKLNTGQITPESLDHHFLTVGDRDKSEALVRLLNNPDVKQAIIFSNAKLKVSEIFGRVKSRVRDIDFLHGGLEQDLRMRIMDRFRRGKLKYVVTTNVMARGLDFANVSHIIHYDVPFEAESYVHRSGRTARMGNRGAAIALVSPRDAGRYREICAEVKINPTPWPLPGWTPSVGGDERGGREGRGGGSRYPRRDGRGGGHSSTSRRDHHHRGGSGRPPSGGGTPARP